jgi:hypothetical protein
MEKARHMKIEAVEKPSENCRAAIALSLPSPRLVVATLVFETSYHFLFAYASCPIL